jgi:hypothetical protein
MHGNDLVKKILEQKNCDNYCLAEKLMNKKYDFKGYVTPRAFDGIKELIEHLKCTKAIVSSSAKKDVKVLLDGT